MTTFRLKPNDSTASPTMMLFVTCSATRCKVLGSDRVETMQLKTWSATYVESHGGIPIRTARYEGKTPRSFWALVSKLAKPKKQLLVISHGVATELELLSWRFELDSQRLRVAVPRQALSEPDRHGDKPLGHSMWVMNDPPTILKCRNETGHTITFVDCRNWFRCGIETLAESVDVAPACDISDDQRSGDDPKWPRERCEVIAGSTLRYFRLIRDHDLGMTRMTVASQAMGCYRHKFLPSNPPAFHDHAGVRCLERRSYFGGRVDCFIRGSKFGDCHQVDVNGLFPSVMKSQLLPRRMMRADLTTDWSRNPPDFNPAASICTVAINSERNVYPYRISSETVYCRGSFVTTLAGPELMLAMESGDIEAYSSWSCYELAPLFSDYVDYWQAHKVEAKKRGMKLDGIVAKLMLNSLYGKFGQRRPVWEAVHKKHPFGSWREFYERDPVTKGVVRYLDIGGRVFRQSEPDQRWERFDPGDIENESTLWHIAGEQDKSSPAIASFITSHARVAMDRYREVAGETNVYYQGIDSLIVGNQGLTRLVDGRCWMNGKLGQLRLESSASSCTIFAGHDYMIGKKQVIGGQQLNSYETTDGFFIADKIPSLISTFSHPPSKFVNIKTCVGKRSVTYTRGEQRADGTIEPLTLDESYHAYRSPFRDAPIERYYGSTAAKAALVPKVSPVAK